MISALVLTGVVMAAGSCEGPFDMEPGRIGTLRLGPVEQITGAKLPFRRSLFADDGGEHYSYVVTLCPGMKVEAYVEADGTDIYELLTASSAFVTVEGAHVGMTVAELKAAYPAGELHYSEVEGRNAGFSTGHGMVFSIDYDNIPDDCFRTAKNCDRLFMNKRSRFVFTY